MDDGNPDKPDGNATHPPKTTWRKDASWLKYRQLHDLEDVHGLISSVARNVERSDLSLEVKAKLLLECADKLMKSMDKTDIFRRMKELRTQVGRQADVIHELMRQRNEAQSSVPAIKDS